MRDRIAESFLAIFAGRSRAAAIMGDLTEMAATYGRGWFVAAYLRTIVSLTWRIVVALFVAEVARELMFNLAGLYFRVSPSTWRSSGSPFLLGQMGPLLAGIMSTLWVVLPFAAVRSGRRDKFVRLTFGVALGTTITFLFVPWVSATFAAGTLMLAVAALISEAWRRAALMLATLCGTGVVLLAALPQIALAYLLLREPHLVQRAPMPAVVFQASLILLLFVYSRLHGWLLRPQSPGVAGA